MFESKFFCHKHNQLFSYFLECYIDSITTQPLLLPYTPRRRGRRSGTHSLCPHIHDIARWRHQTLQQQPTVDTESQHSQTFTTYAKEQLASASVHRLFHSPLFTLLDNFVCFKSSLLLTILVLLLSIPHSLVHLPITFLVGSKPL